MPGLNPTQNPGEFSSVSLYMGSEHRDLKRSESPYLEGDSQLGADVGLASETRSLVSFERRVQLIVYVKERGVLEDVNDLFYRIGWIEQLKLAGLGFF